MRLTAYTALLHPLRPHFVALQTPLQAQEYNFIATFVQESACQIARESQNICKSRRLQSVHIQPRE